MAAMFGGDRVRIVRDLPCGGAVQGTIGTLTGNHWRENDLTVCEVELDGGATAAILLLALEPLPPAQP